MAASEVEFEPKIVTFTQRRVDTLKGILKGVTVLGASYTDYYLFLP